MSRTVARITTAVVVGLCAVLPTSSPTAHAQKKTATVLIVGDSVASVLQWAPAAMVPLWKSQYNVILETWGCQKLVDPGCKPPATPSALDRIKQHKKDNIDVVIIASGNNDTGPEYLRKAIRTIASQVKKQGASLMWITYRENGGVLFKNRTFNPVVKAEMKRAHGTVFDWNAISRRNKHWFTGDSVHMNGVGGYHFAINIKKALNVYFGQATPSTTTSTTTVAPTTPSTIAE